VRRALKWMGRGALFLFVGLVGSNVVLPAVARAQFVASSGASATQVLAALVGQNLSVNKLTATASSGTAVAATSQLACAVDFGPGAADCIGTNGSGYITADSNAVFDVGTSRVQNDQVTTVYLTMINGGTIRRLDSAPISIEGGVRNVAAALGTCSAGTEWTIKADTASGVSTGARSRSCLCTSDGAGSPAYAWQNVVTGNLGTTTTCPN
jgi:hypothetical protein